MQGHTFSHDLHILDLGGYDMVLGVDRIVKQIPSVFDFKKLMINLQHHEKEIELVGHSEEGFLY